MIDSEKVNKGLVALVESLSAYMGVDARVETRMVVFSASPALLSIVGQLVGKDEIAPVVPAPELVQPGPLQSRIRKEPVKVDDQPESDRLCYCGKPLQGKAKSCGEPECVKKQKAEYMKNYWAEYSKKNKPGKAVESVEKEDEDPAPFDPSEKKAGQP